MKQRIPFRIGYQYDNWELNLITLSDRIPENDLYCSYLWVGGKVKKFLNFTPHRTELIFHWDSLEVVILEFDKKSNMFYNKLNGILTKKFSAFTSETFPDGTIIHKFATEKVSYWNIYYAPTKEINVIYFSNKFPYINRILD
ncbi:hypothetical protein D1632_05450 [Chryseobacterium nematophagum]|uniref:Uncharacterized protein n=1 Tax=Chryseobacterium nematophagum TaxID=2305228 RepID=A0A3M7LCA0_9FLAO|nr:hypothetical protein [Chryseobacterium nematophagum]RMZ60383.1 hypothetical protein D1632_05450 [Chryseobacterium nematophagum]